MPKETTGRERRRRQKERYHAGEARRPYTHTPTLNRSLTEESDGNGEEVRDSVNVCVKCRPVLLRYAPIFKGLVHQGSDLKRRKRGNPHPKRANSTPYRDLKRQNEWLRENMFDPMGNYLYCSSCIRASFGVSKQRIANQRKIKRQQFHMPLKQMTKLEVEEQRLGDFVVMPAGIEMCFTLWWRSLASTELVEVRYPHSRHGNAGKTSHSAKTSLMDDFLAFVDMNSQPNGRSADSSGPTFYFLSKFTTIQTPKPGCPNYEGRLTRSVVGEFNRARRDAGKTECSNGSSHNWLRKYRPKHAICPHKEDYCDVCASRKEAIHAKQTALNRLKQAAASEPDELRKLEDELKAIRQSLEMHRQEAQAGHEYFLEVTRKCTEDWKKIEGLETKVSLNEDEEEQLVVLKHKFNLVVSADYQMAKLVPYWGSSPQPGSTYYLQKLSHDLFGVVNHGTNQSTVYLFDERVGPKNTDHTLSYMSHFIAGLPDWVRRLHLFLDNTCSTNKNWFTMAWALEMIQQGKLDFIRVSFLIAGHTKFTPDILFSKIAQSYNKSDVFCTGELLELVSQYAGVVLDCGEIVHDWRKNLVKYSKFPGIRSLHDFIFTKDSVTGTVISRTRKLCHTGAWDKSTIRLLAGRSIDDNVIPDDSHSYLHLNRLRTLSDTKLAHLRQMSTSFIPIDRRLSFLQ